MAAKQAGAPVTVGEMFEHLAEEKMRHSEALQMQCQSLLDTKA
ncbi:MAG: hypothetical protein V3T03_07040 [Candidatus Bipolaricaulota bacterium]